MPTIDLNVVKNSLITTCHTIVAKASEWKGRGIAVIQSGSQKALPYLQDKRIAVVSLVAMSLILIGIADLFSRVSNWLLNHKESVDALVETGIVIGGCIAFSKWAKMPIHPVAVGGIALATLWGVAKLLKEDDK